MAIPSDGVAVVRIDNTRRLICFHIGSVGIELQYLRSQDRFCEIARHSLEGRRGTEHIWLTNTAYRAILRRAHAIARSHGWKE